MTNWLCLLSWTSTPNRLRCVWNFVAFGPAAEHGGRPDELTTATTTDSLNRSSLVNNSLYITVSDTYTANHYLYTEMACQTEQNQSQNRGSSSQTQPTSISNYIPSALGVPRDSSATSEIGQRHFFILVLFFLLCSPLNTDAGVGASNGASDIAEDLRHKLDFQAAFDMDEAKREETI